MPKDPTKTALTERALRYERELPPPDFYDPVIEAYKKDVDRTLLCENLKLTVEQRILKATSFHEMIEELQQAGARARERTLSKG
jgi:hypothetical protein